MGQIKSNYALAVAEQMSLVGVFLGGISVTILISLVVFKQSNQLGNWIVGIAALAGSSLLISVVASLRLIIALHPDFPSPETTSAAEISLLWKSMVASYGAGILCLAVCIGLCGWLRSTLTGIFSSTCAVGVVLFFMSTSIFN